MLCGKLTDGQYVRTSIDFPNSVALAYLLAFQISMRVRTLANVSGQDHKTVVVMTSEIDRGWVTEFSYITLMRIVIVMINEICGP